MQKIKILIAIILFTSGYGFAQKNKIAYCSNQTNSGFIQIFMMNDDGSGKTQLTDLSENCMKPKWSPDGKQIVFYSDKGSVYLIRNVDKAGSLPDPFYVWNGMNPAFMENGTQILFNSEEEDVLSVFVIDTAATQATPQLFSEGGYTNMQVLSKDGSKMLYSTFNNGTKSVMIADLNDTTENYVKKVSKNTDANIEPDISGDGKKITYASFDSNLKGSIRLFEDGQESILTKGMGSTNVPRFSPDGTKIAFVLIGENQVSLYVMDSDGSSKNELNIGGNLGTFEWIDNENILYDAGSETRISVGIVNVDNGSNDIIASGGFNLQASSTK
jgi:Tol biopolymer transport system component